MHIRNVMGLFLALGLSACNMATDQEDAFAGDNSSSEQMANDNSDSFITVEGDMLFPVHKQPSNTLAKKSGELQDVQGWVVEKGVQYWPNNTVPYCFYNMPGNAEWTPEAKLIVKLAMSIWAGAAPLHFNEVKCAGTSMPSYTYRINTFTINDSVQGSSTLGYAKNSQVNLDVKNPDLLRNALHEIGHGLGLSHEFARTDASSSYNVPSDILKDNDPKNTAQQSTSADFASIMNYSNKTVPIISSTLSSAAKGVVHNRPLLSKGDREGIQKLYSTSTLFKNQYIASNSGSRLIGKAGKLELYNGTNKGLLDSGVIWYRAPVADIVNGEFNYSGGFIQIGAGYLHKASPSTGFDHGPTATSTIVLDSYYYETEDKQYIVFWDVASNRCLTKDLKVGIYSRTETGLAKMYGNCRFTLGTPLW